MIQEIYLPNKNEVSSSKVQKIIQLTTVQLTFTCSKSTMKTLEQCLKSTQS